MGRGTMHVHGCPPVPFVFRYRSLPQPGVRLALLAREPAPRSLGRAELLETPFCYGTLRTGCSEHRALVVVDEGLGAFPEHSLVGVGLEDVAFLQEATGMPACVLLRGAGVPPEAEVVYLRSLHPRKN